MSPSASFPKAAVVTGALALGSRALPWLSVGMGIYDWYNQAGLTVNPDGEVGELAGAQQPVSGYSYYAGGSSASLAWGQFADSSSVSAVIVAKTRESWGSNFEQTYSQLPAYNVNGGCGLGKGCFCNKNLTTNAVSCGYGTAWTVSRQVLTQTACALVSTGQIQGNATGGLCPNGAFQPVSQADAASRLNNAPITADVLKRALEEVLKAGGSLQDTGTHSVIGPSSVPGETKTKTTTAANGTTQVTTVTNNYNYSYAGNTITITTTEVIQNPDGSTETTTSDTPDPLCADNPTSLACIKLGDVPTDQPAWETKTIAYQADSLGLPAACPAPWTGQLRGWTLSFSYQPACDVAPQVRLAILALTTLGALLMIITTVRT